MFIDHDEKYLKRYKESDEKGRFFWDTYARPGLGLDSTLFYGIEAPDGSVIENRWIRSKKRFLEELENGQVRIIPKSDTWSIQFKQYLNSQGKKPRSLTMDFGGTADGNKEVISLFNGKRIFDYPKSVHFISK